MGLRRQLSIQLSIVTFMTLTYLALGSVARGADAGPFTFSYGGRLADANDVAVKGPVNISVKFYRQATGGTAIGVSPISKTGVNLDDGVFQIDITELAPAEAHMVFDKALATWIEVTDTTHGVTYPRQIMTAVPYAMKVPVDGTTITYNSNGQLSLGVSGAAGSNQFLTTDGSGNLAWGAPAASATALQGQTVASTAPASGQVLKYDGKQWVPQTISTGSGTVTGVTATAPLVVASGTTAPVISMAQANSAASGYLSSTDWLAFNSKMSSFGYTPVNKAGDTLTGALNMGAQSLTNLAAPTNASDAATKSYVDTSTALLIKKDGSTPLTGAWAVGNDFTNVGNVGMAAQKTLLLGTYAGSQESALTATLVSADRGRTWFNSATNQIKFWDGSAMQTLGVSGAGLTSLNGQSGGAQTFASGTSGTAPNWSSATNTHTINIPMASAGSVTAGLLSNADYVAFNSKLGSVVSGTGMSVATSAGAATITLGNTAVTAGSYTRANISVDAQGRLTSAANGANVNLATEVTGSLPIANGGTGAASAGAARATLGAAASGANSDITSLTGLTTALSVGQGGTGTTATPTSGQLPIGNGTNFTLATLTAGTGITITNGAGAITVAATADASTKLSKAGDTMTGVLNLPANGLVAGTNQLVIAGGNVGIGTTAPGSSLDVNGAHTQRGMAAPALSAAGQGVLYFDSTNNHFYMSENGSSYNQVLTNTSGNTVLNGNLLLGANLLSASTVVGGNGDASGAPSAGTIRAANGSGTNIVGANLMLAGGNGTGTGGSGAIIFQTAPGAASGSAADTLVSRMTITATGNVGIGTPTPGGMLSVKSPSGQNNIATFDTTDGGAVTTAVSGVSLFKAGTQAWKFANTPSASDTLAIADNTNTTRMVITQTGSVGINSTAPAGTLDVSGKLVVSSGGYVGIGTNAPYSQLSNTNVNITDGAAIGLVTATGLGWVSNGSTGYGAAIYNQNAAAGSNALLLKTYDISNSSYLLKASSGAAATDKVVITGAGNVGIGVTNPTYNLHVIGTAGLTSGTAWTNASDIRLKDVEGDYEYGLSEVRKLHTIRFHYKKDNPLQLPPTENHTGFIAQEVREVIPDAVMTRQDGYLELNVDPIHWATVNAVKELADENDRLKAEAARAREDLELLRADSAQKAGEIAALKAVLCAKFPDAGLCAAAGGGK